MSLSLGNSIRVCYDDPLSRETAVGATFCGGSRIYFCEHCADVSISVHHPWCILRYFLSNLVDIHGFAIPQKEEIVCECLDERTGFCFLLAYLIGTIRFYIVTSGTIL